MRYLAIDFETTGIDPKVHQPLSFCGIVDYIGNTTPVSELPRLHVRFIHESWTIHYMAHRINEKLIRRLVDQDFDESYIRPDTFSVRLHNFLVKHGVYFKNKITIAAKNPEFDNGFLKALDFHLVQFRYLDPGPLYVRSEDDVGPSLKTCLNRAGLDDSNIHDESFDAEAVIKLIRKFGHI